MAFTDDRLPKPNIPLPTLGGELLWEDLEEAEGCRLQRNRLTGHCRILDGDDVRLAWGSEGEMRAAFVMLQGGRSARYGDVIGVHRLGGMYDHYGIYESDSCVYEYGGTAGDFLEGEIRTTTLKDFLKDAEEYFVLAFPEEHGRPGKIDDQPAAVSFGSLGLLAELQNPWLAVLGTVLDLLEEFGPEYHLYSPEETVQRARSRLGERQYDPLTNNCEHFALWCKTGVHESHQVDALLKLVGPLFRRAQERWIAALG